MSKRKRMMRRAERGLNYFGRSLALKELGFSSYQDYLASELWAKVKEKVFKAKGRKCKLCDNEAYTIHHNRYHRLDLTGERTEFLQPICRGCHYSIEFKCNGGKAAVMTAKGNFTKRLNRKMARGRG